MKHIIDETLAMSKAAFIAKLKTNAKASQIAVEVYKRFVIVRSAKPKSKDYGLDNITSYEAALKIKTYEKGAHLHIQAQKIALPFIYSRRFAVSLFVISGVINFILQDTYLTIISFAVALFAYVAAPFFNSIFESGNTSNFREIVKYVNSVIENNCPL